METKKNFTIGVLSGMCLTLFLFISIGSTPISNNSVKYEFHDLGDTRGVVFDKVTGKMEYKEIREKPLDNTMKLELGEQLNNGSRLNVNHSGTISLYQY